MSTPSPLDDGLGPATLIRKEPRGDIDATLRALLRTALANLAAADSARVALP
jgi:hypothetical protein